MKSVLLILPYFGKWPIWFEAHLLSIEKNPTINWLIVTDCIIPETYPKNIQFVTTTLAELNHHVNDVVGANVPLTPRKFCDLKPAYGAIFEEYCNGYDFWGFCDMDIIWGDIRKFMTEDVLNNYDIISSRKEAISGHFNLFRNSIELNYLFKQVSNYKILFEQPKFMWFDEEKLTNYIKNGIAQNQYKYRVYWSSILLNQERERDSHQEYYLDRWQWENGKMINTKTDQEVMYLHFINWKKSIRVCEVDFNNEVISFYISHNSIKIKSHSRIEKVWNTFKNFFIGYYAKEYRRIKRLSVKKYIHKIINRIKKTV